MSNTSESPTVPAEDAPGTATDASAAGAVAADTADGAAADTAADTAAAPDPAANGAAAADPAAHGAAAEPRPGAGNAVDRLVREGDVAADYLVGLLDIADLDGDVDLDVEGSRATVAIVDGGLEHLVGPDGSVLEALQELTRLAVQNQTGERSRLMLDIAGFRARRRTELTEIGQRTAEEVRRTGAPAALAPMSAFERKVVHDAVAAAGLVSDSEGEEPRRHVVVRPA